MPGILSNGVKANDTGVLNGALYHAVAWPTDQYSQVRVVDLPATGYLLAVTRTNDAGNTYYAAGQSQELFGNDLIHLYKVVGGTRTDIGSAGGTITESGTDVVRCEAQATTIRAVLNGGVEISGTDASIGTGMPGFIFEAGSITVTLTDDWEGGDFGQGTWTQEGYRWRADDGDEDGAAWLAAQDTGVTHPLATNIRLRLLLDSATVNPPPQQIMLEFTLSTDGTYRAVRPAFTSPSVAWTDTFVQLDNLTTSVISWNAGVPRRGQLLLIVFSVDSDETPTINTTNFPGWVKLGQGTNGTSITGAIFYKFSTGGEVTVTVDHPGSEQTSAVIYCLNDAGTPTGTSANGSSTNPNPPSHNAGSSQAYLWIATHSSDAQVVSTVAPSSYASLITIQGLTATGASTSTAQRQNTTQTEDPGTFTAASEQWVSWTIAIPPAAVPAIQLSPSTHLAAGGADTTAQLAAPGSGHSFGGGRIQDDENPADAVDLNLNAYGEWEWCLIATATAVNTDVYQFRATRDGVALDTYSVTPEWTIGTPAGGEFTITAESGTYALTGTAASLEFGREVAAAAGSYSLTGTAASLEKGSRVAAVSGAYTLTGTAASLEVSYRLAAVSGAFTLMGTAASLEVAHRLVADASTYAVSGQDAGLAKGIPLQAEAGSLAVTGTDASLEYVHHLAAASTAYSLTGQDATLMKGFPISADSGTFALTGTDASVRADRLLNAEADAYALTGTNASLDVTVRIAAETGAYSLSGQAASLLKDAVLAADAGAIALTGSPAALEHGHVLTAEAGAYTLTGTDATLTHEEVQALTAESAAFTLTGTDASLEVAHELVAEGGATALTGTDAVLFVSIVLNAEPGSISLSGQDASFSIDHVLAATPGAIVETGTAAALRVAHHVILDDGAVVMTGVDATLGRIVTAIADPGAVAVLGADALLASTRKLLAAATTYTWTGASAALTYFPAGTIVPPLTPPRLISRMLEPLHECSVSSTALKELAIATTPTAVHTVGGEVHTLLIATTAGATLTIGDTAMKTLTVVVEDVRVLEHSMADEEA